MMHGDDPAISLTRSECSGIPATPRMESGNRV